MIFAKLFFFFLFVCFCSWTSTQRLFNELQKKRGEKQPTRLQIQHYRKSRNVYIWRDTQKKKQEKRGVRFGSSPYAFFACYFSVFLSRINCICRQHGKTRCSIATRKKEEERKKTKQRRIAEKVCFFTFFFYYNQRRSSSVSLPLFEFSCCKCLGTIVFLFPFILSGNVKSALSLFKESVKSCLFAPFLLAVHA